jgi:peptidyl-prolyl cis-trans isomerase-like 4
MSLLLETSLGDITIDLDISNSPNLCRNILKLAKAKYYTNTLIYNVQHGRFCQLGDPRGDGNGGCSIYGLIDATLKSTSKPAKLSTRSIDTHLKHGNTTQNHDNYLYTYDVNVEKSQKRFMKSQGNKILTEKELTEKGRVVATEMGGVQNTIGSQFLITIDSGRNKALDGISLYDNDALDSTKVSSSSSSFRNYYSLGTVTEDDNDVLDKINGLYCDKSGRPYADVRIIRMHILDDPFHDEDPDGMDILLQRRNVKLMNQADLPTKYAICARWLSCSSPKYDKPVEEIVEDRIRYDEAMLGDVDEEIERKRHEETLKKEDKSNAAILEMLGDIGSADMKPPENVLFVCKLNPMTEDEVSFFSPFFTFFVSYNNDTNGSKSCSFTGI